MTRLPILGGRVCEGGREARIRVHDARHTCGTVMHLEHNVPVAIISAWLGHADTAFTMRVHNQPDKLALAAESISSWTRGKKSARLAIWFFLAGPRIESGSGTCFRARFGRSPDVRRPA